MQAMLYSPARALRIWLRTRRRHYWDQVGNVRRQNRPEVRRCGSGELPMNPSPQFRYEHYDPR